MGKPREGADQECIELRPNHGQSHRVGIGFFQTALDQREIV